MRRLLAAFGAGALICGPTVLAFFSGGYFDRPRIVAAIAAWALVALAAFVAPRPLPASTAGRVALAGIALLCAWIAISMTWAPVGERALDDLQRALLYLGFFVAALALLRVDGAERVLEPAMVLGAVVVVGYALSERLLPDLIELSRSRSSAGRLEQPISYWNALGAVAAIGFVLAVRLAGDLDRPRWLRSAAAAAGVWLGLGVYLSFSRGALAAVAAGVLILLALAPSGRAQLRSALTITVAAALCAAVATGFDTITALELGEQGDAGDGLLMLGALVTLSLAAGLIAPLAPRLNLPSMPSIGLSRPVAVLSATVVVVLAGALAVALLEGKPEGTSPAPGADPDRLRSIDTNRYRYWDVALEAWADRPVAGLGAGGFQVRWLAERDRVDASGEAHSLYIETAAELGVVGLAFLLMLLGGTAAAVVRLYRLRPGAGAGLAAGLAAWAVHAGLDWDWEMPAVTMPALLLAAAAVAWSENMSGSEAPRPSAHRPEGRRPSARNLVMRSTNLVIVLMLTVALGVGSGLAPAAALAQSAGDDQYVDPFQGGGDGNNNQAGDGNGSQGGGDGGGGGETTTTPPTTDTPDTTTDGTLPSETVAPTDTTAPEGTVLPRTGVAAVGLAVIGALLLGGGTALRRRA